MEMYLQKNLNKKSSSKIVYCFSQSSQETQNQ